MGLFLVPGSILFALGSWQEKWNEPTLLNLHLYPLPTLAAGASCVFGGPWCLVATGWVWTYRTQRTTPYIAAAIVSLLAAFVAGFLARV